MARILSAASRPRQPIIPTGCTGPRPPGHGRDGAGTLRADHLETVQASNLGEPSMLPSSEKTDVNKQQSLNFYARNISEFRSSGGTLSSAIRATLRDLQAVPHRRATRGPTGRAGVGGAATTTFGPALCPGCPPGWALPGAMRGRRRRSGRALGHRRDQRASVLGEAGLQDASVMGMGGPPDQRSGLQAGHDLVHRLRGHEAAAGQLGARQRTFVLEHGEHGVLSVGEADPAEGVVYHHAERLLRALEFIADSAFHPRSISGSCHYSQDPDTPLKREAAMTQGSW